MQLRQPFLDHIDKLDWKELSSNPNAVLLLEQNLDKIDWTELSRNPIIFEEECGYLLK